MAVLFALLGGGAAIVGAAEVYNNHSDYSDYSNYGNYSNYSDEAERRRRRAEKLKEDLRLEASSLEAYKKQSINPELTSHCLKEESALTVSKEAMDQDVTSRLDAKEAREIKAETKQLETDLARIDELLRKIDEIQGEE